MYISKNALLTMVIILMATGLTSCAEDTVNEENNIEIIADDFDIPEEWDLTDKTEIPYSLCKADFEAHHNSGAMESALKYFYSDIPGYNEGFSEDGLPTAIYDIELYDVMGNKRAYMFFAYFGQSPPDNLEEIQKTYYDFGRSPEHSEFLDRIYFRTYRYSSTIGGGEYGYDYLAWIVLYKPYADEYAKSILGDDCDFVHYISSHYTSGKPFIGYEYTDGTSSIIVDSHKLNTYDRSKYSYIDCDGFRDNPDSISYLASEKPVFSTETIELSKLIWESKTEEIIKYQREKDTMGSNRRDSKGMFIDDCDNYDFPQDYAFQWDDCNHGEFSTTYGTWPPIRQIMPPGYHCYGGCVPIAISRSLTYKYCHDNMSNFLSPNLIGTSYSDGTTYPTYIDSFVVTDSDTWSNWHIWFIGASYHFIDPISIESVSTFFHRCNEAPDAFYDADKVASFIADKLRPVFNYDKSDFTIAVVDTGNPLTVGSVKASVAADDMVCRSYLREGFHHFSNLIGYNGNDDYISDVYFFDGLSFIDESPGDWPNETSMVSENWSAAQHSFRGFLSIIENPIEYIKDDYITDIKAVKNEDLLALSWEVTKGHSPKFYSIVSKDGDTETLLRKYMDANEGQREYNVEIPNPVEGDLYIRVYPGNYEEIDYKIPR